mmetsp:Transcript_79465/g.226915  ORF Transcript_79465/g.226915 Transcript_79465/m.226915 type:complete len:134 (-) Transcript_79465:94-495(-)
MGIQLNQLLDQFKLFVLEHRHKCLKVTLWLLFSLATIFSITAFNIIGKCYVVPCVEDELGMMYKVGTGPSFMVLLSGLIFILQSVYGLWFLRVLCSELVAGAYVGASMGATALALINAVFWGCEASMMANMEE